MDFETYNRHIRRVGNSETIYRRDYKKQINDFQMNVVYPHLSSVEKENQW